MSTKLRIMIKCIGFAILGVLLSTALLANEIISGKVINVIDGNTLELLASDNETYKVLLYGIDCPEIEQEFGDKSKRFLEKLILNKNVDVEIQGKDRLGTRLGVIILNGDDLRKKLLEEGLAWTSERQPIQELEKIKEKAREKGRGLWKEQDPTPPWTFRRQQTLTQFKTS